MSFKITWKTHIECMLITAAAAAVLYDRINIMPRDFLQSGIYFYLSDSIFLNYLIFLILLMIPVSFLHEIIHGAAYKMFKGRVVFGFNGVYAYCRETTGIMLSRNRFLIILISPLISISLPAYFVPHWLVSMVFVLNVLGSSGDILMFLYLCFKPRCNIIDREYGFDIIAE